MKLLLDVTETYRQDVQKIQHALLSDQLDRIMKRRNMEWVAAFQKAFGVPFIGTTEPDLYAEAFKLWQGAGSPISGNESSCALMGHWAQQKLIKESEV